MNSHRPYFRQLVPRRLRMLVAPAARRGPARPHPRDRARQARPAGITASAASWGSGRFATGSAGIWSRRRRENTTGRAGCRRSRRPRRPECGSSGTCSTTARPIMWTRPATTFPSASPSLRWPRWRSQNRSAGARRLVCPLNEINFLSWAVDDGYFPHVGPEERGWFKRQLVRAAITAARAIKRALARRDHRLGRAADPHRAARPPPPDDPRRPGEPSGDVRGL